MSKCSKCSKNNKSIRDNLCQFCKAESDGINAEVLKDLYFKQNLSVIDISKKLNYPISTMYKIFIHFNVNRKSLSETALLSESKRIQTRLDKYGYSHNFDKGCKSRVEWETKLFNEEGITNVFQRQSVKDKSLKTFLDRYKKEPWLYKITSRGRGVVSNLNKKVFKILVDNNLDFDIEFKLKNPKARYYAYNIILKNSNKIIEVNGDYWHGNPKLYKADDLLLKGSSQEITYKEKWAKDKKKIRFARNRGYKIIVIWEHDLKNNYDRVLQKILKYARS